VQLRLRFDQLREYVLTSTDSRRATEKAIEEILKSIANVDRALGARGMASVKERMPLYTHDPTLTFWTSLGGITAAAVGIPVHVGLASGMAVSTMCKQSSRARDGFCICS